MSWPIKTKLDYHCARSVVQFCEGIRLHMALQGVKLKRLAGRLGYSRRRLQDMLTGKRDLTIDQMQEVASALGLAVHVHVEREDIAGGWVRVSEMRPPALEADTDQTEEPPHA